MIIKKIPYGLTDFERIRKEPYYYVDKTHYIEWLEESANFFFLIRPRRFGKSLFINMLRWYYDIYRRDRFKEIFEGLLSVRILRRSKGNTLCSILISPA